MHAVDVSPFWIIPFASLLAAIALMPFINKHWWEHNYHYVSYALAALVGGYYCFVLHEPVLWLHGMTEYVSFIVLLASLFVISGGIIIHVGRRATPATNCTLLLIGAILANLFGTTGASMLLIRPFIRMNKDHIKPFHVVFFIFIVSNAGGCLTPIGDPPLFLGYLRGIPFWWTLEHLWPQWLLVVGILTATFFVLDTRDHRETQRPHLHDAGPQVNILGIQNFIFIAIVIVAVFCPSIFELIDEIKSDGATVSRLARVLISREVLMAAAGIGSYFLTKPAIHEKNEFNFGPIKEVAILFVGIFATMVPALNWLEFNADKMPLRTPGQFYYSTGVLSAVLDNAPTYLTFLQIRMGELPADELARASQVLNEMGERKSLGYDPAGLPEHVTSTVDEMVREHPDRVLAGKVSAEDVRIAFLTGIHENNIFIIAVSAGAVFFGAMTYIGNGPNFMVKAIADSSGIKMPGFVQYVTHYALPFLLPAYVLVWLIFLI